MMLAKPSVDESDHAALELHRKALLRFVERAQSVREAKSETLTLILRSASSLPALALVETTNQLAEAGIRPRIILSKLEPKAEFKRLIGALNRLSGDGEPGQMIRWAKNPRLLDAHEQVILGTDHCWAGDAMRRDPARRNALSLFSESAGETVRLAELAFTALWRCSVPVPQRYLAADERRWISVAKAPMAKDAIDASLVPPTVQVWPLIRH